MRLANVVLPEPLYLSVGKSQYNWVTRSNEPHNCHRLAGFNANIDFPQCWRRGTLVCKRQASDNEVSAITGVDLKVPTWPRWPCHGFHLLSLQSDTK